MKDAYFVARLKLLDEVLEELEQGVEDRYMTAASPTASATWTHARRSLIHMQKVAGQVRESVQDAVALEAESKASRKKTRRPT